MIYNIKDSNNRVSIQKPVIPLIMLTLIIVIGTIGYYILWEDNNATWIDALYMVMITITTIGYEEVYPIVTGFQRSFTIFVGVIGISSLFYLFGNIMENLFLLQTLNIRGRKKMKKSLEELNDHFIIVGYGRVGQLAAKELEERNKKYVVIDVKAPSEAVINENNNAHVICGDATEDDVLLLAGIKLAKSIIIATPKAEITVFVVLSSKQLNPNLHIVARTDSESIVGKLKRAGADRVVNPYEAGGFKLATLAINPLVIDFLDTSSKSGKYGFNIEQLIISDQSPWIGRTLKDLDIRNKSGVSIIRVIRNRETILNPYGDFIFEKNDQIVAVGNHSQLHNLESAIK